jgi:outer membrane protein assembly factor BamB
MASALCFFFLFLPAAPADAKGDNWPGFRGPHETGASTQTGLPTKWSDTENLRWKTKLPGPGGSSPITFGDRVFVTCYTGYGIPADDDGDPKNLKRHLLCLDRKKGTILWDKEVAAKLPESRYNPPYITLHGYASSTPVTDGERVYVFFGKSGVFAFDFSGKELWHADVGTRTHVWGSATSPVLYKDLVIVNASVESEALIAFQIKDGKEAWKCPGTKGSWNSPVLVDVAGGKKELVMRAPGSVLGVDPASGKKLWHVDVVRDLYVCPTVVANDGIIYSLGGRFQGLTVAIKAGGQGDVTATHKLWSKRLGGPIPSPVLVGENLYWVSDDGTAYCVKAKDGSKVYQERLKNAGRIYASAAIADGKIYVVTREKGTFVLAAKPKFEVLAHNVFESDRSIFNGSPAISKGELLLRSDTHLYCIGNK